MCDSGSGYFYNIETQPLTVDAVHTYQSKSGVLAHLEDVLGVKVDVSASTGVISTPYSKNSFIYKGTTDGIYQLPNPIGNHGREVFIINKTSFDLKIEGELWDFSTQTEIDVSTGATLYLFCDGEHWATY